MKNEPSKIFNHYVKITDDEYIAFNKITVKSVKEKMNGFHNELNSFQTILETIKTFRDKTIAHNDLYRKDNIAETIGNFTYKDMYALIEYTYQVTNYLKLLLENKTSFIEHELECDL